jgi:hypothetical protein
LRNLAGIDTGLAIQIDDVCSIAHEATGNRVLAPVVNGRRGVSGKRRDLFEPAGEKEAESMLARRRIGRSPSKSAGERCEPSIGRGKMLALPSVSMDLRGRKESPD